jgi:hypothetical protein
MTVLQLDLERAVRVSVVFGLLRDEWQGGRRR